MNKSSVVEAKLDTIPGELCSSLILLGRIQQEEGCEKLALKGMLALLEEVEAKDLYHLRIDKVLIDRLISNIDVRIGSMIDSVLHFDEYQRKESIWRSLGLLVKNTKFNENIEINILNVKKDDLEEDFKDYLDTTQSGLYKKVYSEEYGQFGGAPYAAIISDYEFTSSSKDISLLKNISAIAAVSHCPFIAATSSEMFGLDGFQDLDKIKDVSALFEGPRHAKWRSFRETEDARYVGLTLPRFLLREPYTQNNNPVKEFVYNERVGGDQSKLLWGNTSFLFASRITDSFAKYRWCPNIVGPRGGGSVDDLPLYEYESMGELQYQIPTEILVTDRLEYELSEQGFIALTMRKNSDSAVFFSANSVQKPKFYGTGASGKSTESNYKLGTQLPYLFIVTRLAHYIKVLQRENIGSWKSKADISKELNNWVRQYVSDQDNPPIHVRCRKPLRAASIAIEQPDGDPGWYNIQLDIVPHFKYMGANFTLTLKGKLDKES